MVIKLVRRPLARLDLIEIWKFIAKDNEKYANLLLDKIESTLLMLQDNPYAGKSRADLSDNMRSFSVGQYILFYCILSDKVELIRVLNSYRDVESLLV